MGLKDFSLCVIGIGGGLITSLFGGWDSALTTLVVVMAADYITGLIVAGVFHKSKKTEHGKLESRIGWHGLFRKAATLIIVVVAARLDMTMGTGFLKDALVIGFIANEVISLIENAGLMGLPVPEALQRGVELLNDKSKSGK